MAQSDAAAERSAHVVRQGPAEARCFVCGGAFKGGASVAARILPPLVQVCSAACAADPRFTRPAQAGA